MNTIADIFNEIAFKEKGNYHNKSLQHTGKGFTPFNHGKGYNVPEDRHLLEVPYKNYLIQVIYELGNHNLAEVKCELASNNFIPNFSITTNSHFKRLIRRKNNIIKVTTDDEHFKTILMQVIQTTGLEQLARDNKFEPKISMINHSPKILLTKFHLEFPDKMEVIAPLLQLYRFIIDY